MGGRGASSGISKAGKVYGSEYKTLHTSGNIKFVSKVSRDVETLMETKTNGRVYATVGGSDLISITYFDTSNKRVKTIDLKHVHKKMKPHVHHGYEHNEKDGKKGASKPNEKERRMIERVYKEWYNYRSGRK